MTALPRWGLLALVSLGLLGGGAAAQGMGGRGLDGQRALPPSELRMELVRQKQRLDAARADKDRLLVLLAHAALGHDVGDGVAVLIERTLDSTEMDREQARLDELQKELVRLNGEYSQWRARADRELLADAEVAESPLGVGPGGLPMAAGLDPTPAAPGGEFAAPDRRSTPSAAPPEADPEDESPTVFGLVKGSTDHGAVGRLLFLAGRSLAQQGRRAIAEGDAERGADLRTRARRKFEQGVRELRQVLYVDPDEGGEYRANAAFQDLFHEARCLLGVFDIDAEDGAVGYAVDVRLYEQRMEAVRRPLLEITARDVTTRDGAEVRGHWGASAEALLDQLRWRMAQDGYEPPTADVSWREEK